MSLFERNSILHADYAKEFVRRNQEPTNDLDETILVIERNILKACIRSETQIKLSSSFLDDHHYEAFKQKVESNTVTPNNDGALLADVLFCAGYDIKIQQEYFYSATVDNFVTKEVIIISWE